jgi:large subunit ribosomal protein L1
MSEETKFAEAVRKLREGEKKKFDQTADLIINLKDFDVRKESFNAFIQLPHIIKQKKIFGFLEKETKLINTLTKDKFSRFKDKKEIKNLTREYDSFVANAKLMPAVATTFGRFLGPLGKMPSPQLGILSNEEDSSINEIVNRINCTARIRVKEPSIKFSVGKESLSDQELTANAFTGYNQILKNLPKGKDNVRNVKIKFTMGKTIDVGV